ncbi:DNA polymerase III subunit delta [Spiroplasma sabaudiense Ar-1343]|uniref:DNA polymerase III subunit delta n=1 Tax=Spiroplasma sabaudiense Ar-1343 TaxID=1276257 RepID=W6AJI9_9MOLU|nr:DNA polymerase III subunit delta [Spiroplasma sabaudiense]AHI53884.1 DNA polymerase III subunit delta [Spiroplasma sabaudiense Ar-1343]
MNLIIGTDAFLVEKELEKTTKIINKNKDFEIIRFNLIEEDFENIVNQANTFSLFSSQKLIIIEECWFLTEKKVNLNKSFSVEKFQTFIENFPPENSLILTLNESKISKKLKIGKFVESKFKIIEIPALNINTAYNFIEKKLNHEGILFDSKAIWEFLNIVPLDARVIRNEISKLIGLGKPIDLNNVNSVLNEYYFYDIFKIVNSFLNEKIVDFMSDYYKYIQLNKDVLGFIYLIISSLIQVRNIIILKNKSYNFNHISERLGINMFRINKLLEIKVQNLDKINDKIKEMYVIISNILKGNFDSKVIPELSFIKLMVG